MVRELWDGGLQSLDVLVSLIVVILRLYGFLVRLAMPSINRKFLQHQRVPRRVAYQIRCPVRHGAALARYAPNDSRRRRRRRAAAQGFHADPI